MLLVYEHGISDSRAKKNSMIFILSTIAIIAYLIFWDIVLFKKLSTERKNEVAWISFVIGTGCVLAIIIIKIKEFYF